MKRFRDQLKYHEKDEKIEINILFSKKLTYKISSSEKSFSVRICSYSGTERSIPSAIFTYIFNFFSLSLNITLIMEPVFRMLHSIILQKYSKNTP